jgi:hypothetical protein
MRGLKIVCWRCGMKGMVHLCTNCWAKLHICTKNELQSASDVNRSVFAQPKHMYICTYTHTGNEEYYLLFPKNDFLHQFGIRNQLIPTLRTSWEPLHRKLYEISLISKVNFQSWSKRAKVGIVKMVGWTRRAQVCPKVCPKPFEQFNDIITIWSECGKQSSSTSQQLFNAIPFKHFLVILATYVLVSWHYICMSLSSELTLHLRSKCITDFMLCFFSHYSSAPQRLPSLGNISPVF